MIPVRTPARPRTPARLRRPSPVRGRSGPRPPARWRGRGDDRGQASIEFLGFLPILLVVALAVVQLGLAAYTVQQAGTAARAAARTASMDRADRETDPQTAGREAISGWVAERATIVVGGGGDTVRATARVRIPSLIPGVDFGSASRSATMPRPPTPSDALGPAVRTVEGAPPR
ncbi:TadE family protein [Streptomyces sp. NPDC048506]|uniref:TadE/TadG family type IV pilus assembly protein n=1 Tax=Streptomyces sp. NPDC048506 TaxID=3155028 RepID=UPI00343F53C6